jgi:two-component system, sensor histidine kinase
MRAIGPPEEQEQAMSDGPKWNPSILVAEDNPFNSTLVVRMIEKLGFHAERAQDGREALEMARSGKFDIILMDMQMPEMDGLEATLAIRALALGRRPRIVALTANAFAEDRDRCLEAGMDDFLSKPFRVDDLRAKLAFSPRSEPSLRGV